MNNPNMANGSVSAVGILNCKKCAKTGRSVGFSFVFIPFFFTIQ